VERGQRPGECSEREPLSRTKSARGGQCLSRTLHDEEKAARENRVSSTKKRSVRGHTHPKGLETPNGQETFEINASASKTGAVKEGKRMGKEKKIAPANVKSVSNSREGRPSS